MIRRATTRANALIQDLLDVSRIESGTLAVDLSPTSAAGLLNDAVLDLEPLVKGKGLRCEHEWIGADAEIPADRGRIAQVFSNLVGNAVKFTPKDGAVRVTGRRLGSGVEYVVSDTALASPATMFRTCSTASGKRPRPPRRDGARSVHRERNRREPRRLGARGEFPGSGTSFHFTLPGTSEGSAYRRRRARCHHDAARVVTGHPCMFTRKDLACWSTNCINDDATTPATPTHGAMLLFPYVASERT